MKLIFAVCFTLLFSASAFSQEEGSKPDSEQDEASWDINNPPGEWNTITINTDQITWANVDVSPDGKTIVFDMLGDIYTVPVAGGEAEALTADIAWNMQPKFSPDGTGIAFISDRNGGDNLWVMAADGSAPRELTNEKANLFHNPAWTPDGQWIAARKGYVSTRSIPAGAIWMTHASGGKGLEVVARTHGEQSQKNIAEPAFSADGRYLFYSQDTTPGQAWQYNKDSTGSIFTIKRLDRETGETIDLVSGPGGAIRPTPSPDGKHLAFVKRHPDMTSAIYLMDLKSGNERLLAGGLDRDLQEANGGHGNTPAIAWTSDSRSVVYWAGGRLRQMALGESEARMIPVRVNAEKKVRQAVRFPVEVSPDEFRVKAIRWAQYSPDGRQVVFQALGHLYVRDVASGRQKRLTRQNDHFEFWPRFSADGRSVIYTTWDDQELGSVRIVSVRGGKGKVISAGPGHYVEARFAPSGNQVVYRKFSGGHLLSPKWSGEPGIYVADTDGGNTRKVLSSGFNPQFSRDDSRLIFSDVEDNTMLALKSVDINGKDERTHYKAAKGTEFSVSPDGQWLAFTEHYNAYLAPLATIGKTVDIGKGVETFPVRQVASRAGEGLHWSDDSASLHWAHGATLYSRDLKDAFAFLDRSPEGLPEPVESGLDLSFIAKVDAPEGTTVITGARVVTMRESGGFEEVIPNGVIVVQGKRITAVGSADEVELPADAYVVNAEGKTVIPGLVDVHAHGSMGSNEITPEQNWMQYSNLAFGVTTIHDPSNDTTEIFSHAELQKTGQVVGSRTYSTGTILYGALVPAYAADVNSYEDALFHVRRLKEMGAISVKSYNQLRRDSRQQVIAAGQELGIMVVPEGGAKFQHNLTHIVDGHTGVEHALPIANIYDDVIQLWSQTAVGYSPTFGVAYGGLSGETYWYDRTKVYENERLLRYTPKGIVFPASYRRLTAPDQHYNHIAVARHAKSLRDRNVAVVIGAHGQREGLAAHWEMWMMHQGGFTAWEAIRGATIDGARYLGMDNDLGSIEAGKLADLVIIDGNPLDDLRQSEMVSHTMINGRLYEAATMNRVGNETTQRQPFFFELEGGDAYPVATQRAFEKKARALHWVH